jgi:hypothetical protein
MRLGSHREGPSGFIGMDGACKLAQEAVRRESEDGGRIFAAWKDASLGGPVLVLTVHREPSYWLVPVEVRGAVMGFVRVLGDGRVAHVGSFSPSPDIVRKLPEVTGITQEEAAEKAYELIRIDQGESPTPPVFVHDGPIGREAWLVEVLKDEKPHRWIFVTPSFAYERPAGAELGETG